MFIFRNPYIFFETPNGATSGAPVQPAQPTTPQPTVPEPTQATQQGQGQPQGQGNGFRTTFFPNVPDDQWAAIEPHISGVNQYVTQLQQRYAPFSSYTPEAVQGLARFADAFDQDPTGQWILLARTLQQNGRLDPNLDIDHLEGLLTGQAVEEPPQEGIPGQQADPRDQIIKQLQQQLKQVTDRLDQGDQKQRQTIEDAALRRTMSWMKDQLRGQIPDELLTNQRLMGMFVSHGGNAQSAVQDAIQYRTALLGGVVPDPQQQQQRRTLDTPSGVPQAKQQTRPRPGAGRRGMLGDASVAAEQFLRRANQPS